MGAFSAASYAAQRLLLFVRAITQIGLGTR